MAYEIRVPRLGWSMEEGKFIGWLKSPGEEVSEGDALFELENEKSLEQIPAIDSGTLVIPADSPAPGSVVAVGAILGFLVSQGEAVPVIASSAVSSMEPCEVGPVVEPVVDRVRVDKPVSSPRARRVAGELGVDWKTLSGTGRDGRIREADVRGAVAGRGVHEPLSPRRRAIAERLRTSLDRAIPVTVTSRADATHLNALRSQFKAAEATVTPSFNDIVCCLVAKVLRRHPRMAARWDDGRRGLIPMLPDQIGIGIAVDTSEGLLVPVVKDVAGKSLMEVARESRRLIELARLGRLSASEMSGGVFTITNLGGFGIDAFTPVINPPEVAILGLGLIRREPVVLDQDRVVARDRITLSLTFDHAAVDGAPAAAFLRDVAAAIENPAASLLGE